MWDDRLVTPHPPPFGGPLPLKWKACEVTALLQAGKSLGDGKMEYWKIKTPYPV